MTDRPGYFIDNDADNEPTLWVTHADRPDYPLPLIRRCDIPPNGRAYVWSLIEEAHA